MSLVSKFRSLKRRIRLRKCNAYIRRLILNYYRKNDPGRYTGELRYIKDKGVAIFPYKFNDDQKYDYRKVEVFTDDECGLKYIIHEGRKLYFPPKQDSHLQRSYAFLCKEQDPLSPHCYQSEKFHVNDGDILFDIGSAEGLFSLSVIDKVSKLFLFETDETWLKPLEKTFEPWKDKVVIIPKFASDKDSDKTVTIDSLAGQLDDSSPVLLKIDVEGAEAKVLEGAKGIISGRAGTRAVVCTYHNREDYDTLSAIMRSHGYNTEPSNGYMLFMYDKNGIDAPFFRHGVIYCSK